MMIAHFPRTALAVLLFGALGPQLAHADIYTWVDTSGAINVSNLTPPVGARVTSIIHASAPEAARDAAAREAGRQTEVQALNDRMRQLESEVELASRQAPPPDYRPLPAPAVVQYFVNAAPPPEQYAVDTTAPAYAGCNPGWIGCSGWWPYPAIVVVGAPNFRPSHPGHGQRDFTVQPQPPMHPPFTGQPPMHPPFGGQPPLHPPFAAQQSMSSPLGVRRS
jgi:hypothetical protein